jgi:hypothetical protein
MDTNDSRGRRVAIALAADLGAQDPDMGGKPLNMANDLTVAYLDQGQVDMARLAKAAIEAARPTEDQIIAITSVLFPGEFHDGSDCRNFHEAPGEPCPICKDCHDAWLARVEQVRNALGDTPVGDGLTFPVLSKKHHTKRGTDYNVYAVDGRLNFSCDVNLLADGIDMTIYRDQTTGKWSCRPTFEFNDGRFVDQK